MAKKAKWLADNCFCCRRMTGTKKFAGTWSFCRDCIDDLDLLCEQHDYSLERAAPALRRVRELAPQM